MDPALAGQVSAAVTSIYEACGFQDITGQRITKVVTALQKIESKVEALLQAFGDDIKREGSPRKPAKKTQTPSGAPARPDEDLLNGPQLPENAISQRSEEHTSELQSLMRISYAVFCLKKKKSKNTDTLNTSPHR